MKLEEAKKLAQEGFKLTHEYFTENEWMTMKGNVVVFEDGVQIFFDDWVKGKDYLLDGWKLYRK